jgi:phage-related baseplate assembly protein
MTSITLTDLGALGTPEIVEQLDFEAILAGRKSDLLALLAAANISFDAGDLEVEPVVALLEEAAFKELALRARGNEIALARYLYFATGSAIDHMAAFYDVVRMAGETDDRLKVRVILACQGRSTGGTAARYRLVALSTTLDVGDAIVYVETTSPAVRVAVFAADGGIADADLLAAVAAALNATDVRMVNDTIIVESAVIEVVTVTAALKLLPDTPTTVLDSIAASLKSAWNDAAGLGRDLTLDWIRARLMADGVHSVTLTAPTADVSMVPRGAAQIGTVTLSFAGRAF